VFSRVENLKESYDVIVIGSGFGALFFLQKLRHLQSSADVLLRKWRTLTLFLTHSDFFRRINPLTETVTYLGIEATSSWSNPFARLDFP